MDKETAILPSTSRPCTWNKGKKRAKAPKPIHFAEYPSSKRKPPSKLYNWDPRPEEGRGASANNAAIADFISSIRGDKMTKWETLLKIKYSDFVIDEADIALYKQMCNKFKTKLLDHNETILKSRNCCEIPETMEQSNSEKWHNERKYRVTASVCKAIVNMGEHLSANDSLRPHFNWLEKNFWFPTSFTTASMRYGMENEANALKEYAEKKQVFVAKSGLWINKNYVHLAASPDGLIFDESSNVLQSWKLNV